MILFKKFLCVIKFLKRWFIKLIWLYLNVILKFVVVIFFKIGVLINVCEMDFVYVLIKLLVLSFILLKYCIIIVK